jgi:hypothetical protein
LRGYALCIERQIFSRIDVTAMQRPGNMAALSLGKSNIQPEWDDFLK